MSVSAFFLRIFDSTVGLPAIAVDLTEVAIAEPVCDESKEPVSHVIPEPEGSQALAAQFGLPLVDALHVAFVTKNLVILTGAPGVGKSWIASPRRSPPWEKTDGEGPNEEESSRP